MTFTKKNWITLLISVSIMVASLFVPSVFGMPKLAVRALLFTVAILILLVTETMHIGIIAIFMVILQPILGLTGSFNETVQNFSTPIFFFQISAFIIAGAVQESQLSKRILKMLLMKFGKSTKGMITAILLATALLSSVIANLPALVLFYSISLNFLDMFEDPQERKQTGKSLCIGLIYAALCGGVTTVVGNMNPMLASSSLMSAGYNVSFLQWMAIGLPVGVILFPIMLLILFKLFPPVEISAEKRKNFIDSINISPRMSLQEKTVTAVFILMLVFWLLGSSFPVFNTMHVSICGAAVLLLPCFKIMNWQKANQHIAWPVILLTCSFVSLAAIFTSTGLTDWILGLMDVLIPANANTVVIVIILGVITTITLLLISNGPALVTIFAPPVIALATARGIHPVYLMLPLSMFMAYTILLPIDSIALVTYASNTYSMKDEFKAGLPFAICGILVTSVVTTLMASLLGF